MVTMIRHIDNIFLKLAKGSEIRRAVRNIGFLTILQGANSVLPLILLPYLVRVLGIDMFGVLVFVQVFVGYFQIAADYGFSWSGTRAVAVCRDNVTSRSELFCSIIATKLLLSILCCGAVCVAVIVFEKSLSPRDLVLLSLGTIIGNAITPLWFFQGMERMDYFAVFSVIPKALSTAAIFALVRTSEDVALVPLFQSAGGLLGGVLSIFAAVRLFELKAATPQFNKIWQQLAQNWQIFASTIGISLYRNTNIFLLGLIGTPTEVGSYAIAEKLVKAVQGAVEPVSQSLFPMFGNKVGQLSQGEVKSQLFRISKFYAVGLSMLCLLLIAAAAWIVPMVFGNLAERAVLNVQIGSFVIFFGGLNFLFGVVGLVNFGKKNAFLWCVNLCGLFNLPFCFLMSTLFRDTGASMAFSVSEGLLTLLFLRQLSRLKRS